MVDARLFSYVQQQLQAGYDVNTIRNYLLQNRYPQNEVDAVFQALQQGQRQPSTSPQPAQPQQQGQIATLVNYFKQYMQQGYSAEQVQTFLVQNGYPQNVVVAAKEKATKKPFQLPHVALPSKKTFLVLLLFLLIAGALAATAWFFMNLETEEEPEIDFDVSIAVDVVAPGETLYINNDFINFPEKRPYSMTVYYTINDKETLTRIDSWQVSVDPTDSILEAKSVKHTILRTTEVGEYELNVKLSYGTTTKQLYEYFTVSTSEEEIAQAEKVAAEEEVQAEETIVEESEAVAEETTSEEAIPEETEEVVETVSETGIPSSNDYVNLATAKEVAKTDPEAAIEYCEQITTLAQQNSCYWNVARNSGDKSYCGYIVADYDRDACWIEFAFQKGDYTVCENISNPWMKQSCEQLKKGTEAAALQGYT